MGTLTIEHANAMPAPTWHRLKMTDADIELPGGLAAAQQVEVSCEEGLRGEADAFDRALRSMAGPLLAAAQELGDQPVACAADQGLSPVEPASVPTSAAHQVDDQGTLPAAIEDGTTAMGDGATAMEDGALSLYQQQALENRYLSPGDVFATGMGDEAREYLEFVVGTRLRVFAGADARVDIMSTQTLDDSWIALDDAGIVADERVRVQVRHTVLGAGRSYTGLDADLRGDDARLDIDTRYLARGDQQRDFNYVVHQRGRRTVCNLDANGVLAGQSEKTLRGTIELVHGCKGSVGSEQETVLLADERVVNRTVPVILCDEDDVAGNHGATIGHIRPEQLLYLASRGISPDDAERLFIAAAYQEAATGAPDERTRAAVTRLAAARGITLEEAVA